MLYILWEIKHKKGAITYKPTNSIKNVAKHISRYSKRRNSIDREIGKYYRITLLLIKICVLVLYWLNIPIHFSINGKSLEKHNLSS